MLFICRLWKAAKRKESEGPMPLPNRFPRYYEDRNKSMFCRSVVAVCRMNERRKCECIKMSVNENCNYNLKPILYRPQLAQIPSYAMSTDASK